MQNDKTPKGDSAQNVRPRERVAVGKARGDSGVVILNGMITGEEYNRRLAGKEGIKAYDEMRNSDATVGALLEAIKQPLIGAPWRVEAGGDTPLDKEIAEALEVTLFERIDFQALLYEMLTALDFGHWVGAKYYVYDDVNGKKMITLDRERGIETRKQATIYAWETRDHKPGITQQTFNEVYDIPRASMMLYSFRREGKNYEGRSILRRAFKHWDIKTKLEIIQAIGLERQGVGVLYIKHPESYGAEEMEAAVDAARQLRANEEAYVKIPDGWEIGFMDMGADKTMDPSNAIAYHDRQIFMAGLLGFLTIGSQTSSGSYSASNDQAALFQQCEENTAKAIERVLFNDFVKQWVDLNWTTDTYPKVTHGEINPAAITVLAEALQKFKTGGFITPDVEIEKHLRKAAHLPEMSEEMEQNYDEIKNPPMAIDEKTGLPIPQPKPGLPGPGGKPAVKPEGNPNQPVPPKATPESSSKVKAESLIAMAATTHQALLEGIEEIHATAT